MSGLGTPDLATFNRWLCLTRLKNAGAVFLFTLVLQQLGIPDIAYLEVRGVCAGLFLVSFIGLLVKPLAETPRLFFTVQCLADLAAITLGIFFSVHGLAALVFRPIYALVIVPASLVSVPSGLLMAAVASVGHEVLLGFEQGFSLATLITLESLAPCFLFFMLAQQGFFYGAHLRAKNIALTALAARLEENRQRLVNEARMSTALLDVARTLASTLEEPEILSRLNSTTKTQLDADWSATFLVDAERASFRLAAISEAEASPEELGPLECPMRSWAPVERLMREPAVVLTGAEAGRVPGLFASRRDLTTMLLAGLYRDRVLVGFLAVGYVTLPSAERGRQMNFLTAIAQHAIIVLRNSQLLEQVQLSNAMKSEFVGAVSHELRSPLNVMLGYLEMMVDGELGPTTEEQLDALKRVRAQSLALLDMISALLDMNRLEAGRMPVQRAPVAIGSLLEDIRQQLPEGWRRPEVELRLAVVPKLPMIETDAGKLKTVIRNLLHNAFKFTERGRVTLGAGLTETGDIMITVSDTGRGIPPDAIRYIFDMFRQVPGAGGGGVGLGLHLVRRLLHVLGGTITVTSQVGKGTCFTIVLPRSALPIGPGDHGTVTADAAPRGLAARP